MGYGRRLRNCLPSSDRVAAAWDMPPGLTVDQQTEWLKCAADPAYFIRTCCQIELDDGAGGLLWGLFEPWPLQLEAIPLLDKAKKAILLKARQQGLTWIAICLALHRMIFKPVAAILMFSKTDDDAKEMTRRLGGVWERLPDWLRRTGRRTRKSCRSPTAPGPFHLAQRAAGRERGRWRS